MMFVTIIVLFALISTEVHSISSVEENFVLSYLTQYGYLKRSEIDNEVFVKEALIKLQRFYGLPETGVMDNATLKHVKNPRCGLSDIHHQTRFNAKGPWLKRNLTYYVGAVTPHLTHQQVVNTLQDAMNTWTQHVDLNFTHINDPKTCDILIFFASMFHGKECDPFDGPGLVLAHAFGPQNGDIHFDNDEIWNLDGLEGYDLFSVALHELGHALGLGHSGVKESVMYGYFVARQLHQDDINGIKALYP